MTHEEKLQLAKAQGILEAELTWARIQYETSDNMLQLETDPFARGLAWGEVAVAKDTIASIEKAIALLEPLWREHEILPF